MIYFSFCCDICGGNKRVRPVHIRNLLSILLSFCVITHIFQVMMTTAVRLTRSLLIELGTEQLFTDPRSLFVYIRQT